MTEDKAELKSVPEYLYAFTIIKDLRGNIGIKPYKEGEIITTEQLYQACETICRNIQAQDISQAVAAQLLQAAQSAGRTESGLVVPDNVRKKK